MGIFSDTVKVQWKHFGHKYKLPLTKEDINSEDVFEILMKKVNTECPNFEGLIACLDYNNRQLIIKNDADLRKALENRKDKLKIYTTLQERGSLPTVDYIGNRVCRSYSVPPKGCQVSPPAQPTSATNNPETEQASESPDAAAAAATTSATAAASPRQHTPLSRGNRSNSSFMRRNRHSFRSGLPPPTSASHTGYTPMPHPMGYHQSYSSYNNAPGGVPPINMMLNHVLTGGRYPPLHPAYGSRPFIF
uniref:PB1 domain-containing protein n=1 Tax=Panagrolaimus davidi TaxID=227884 RepID=A0A914QN19_9BILA